MLGVGSIATIGKTTRLDEKGREMRHVKHLLVTALAVILAFVMAVPAFAAGNGSITVTPPTGTDANASNTYTLYKVFAAETDGTNYSYKLSGAHEDVPAGFILDDAGNVYLGTIVTAADNTTFEVMVNKQKVIVKPTTDLSDTIISAIAGYVTSADQVGEAKTVTGTNPATWTGLDNGYYYVTTTTGTLVIIDSTVPTVSVTDKNTVPGVDKKITGATSVDEDGKKALAQVGTTVNYSAEITIGDGAKGYVFHDTMETGLTYKNDAAVSYDGTPVEAAGHFTIGKKGDDTFTITFEDDYVKTLTVGKKITVTYSATVNSDAITVDPLNNTCYVNYGDANSNNKTPTSEADVYEAKFTVTKQDGKGAALANAGFVIKNSQNKYYKITDKVVSWVDSIDDATEYTSDAQGAVQAFTGLANGTYTLIEKTVPAGYNKAADSTFTIAEHNYTSENLEQEATVVNNQGAELPSTGGIGTTIIYIVGGGMVLAGIVMFLTKRRMASVEE